MLYFIDRNEGLVRAKATAKDVLNSGELTEKAFAKLLRVHQDRLQLTEKQVKRWAGERYLVLITVGNVTPTAPFAIDRGDYGSRDDWLLVGDIQSEGSIIPLACGKTDSRCGRRDGNREKPVMSVAFW